MGIPDGIREISGLSVRRSLASHSSSQPILTRDGDSMSLLQTPDRSTAFQACADDRVLTLAESALISSLSIATFRRTISAGDGPTLTRLSGRRLGVRVRDLRQWLDSRAVAPGEAAA